MGMTTCRECGKQISSTARACPHCGAKLKMDSGPKGCLYIIIGTAAIIGGTLLLLALGGCAYSQTYTTTGGIIPNETIHAEPSLTQLEEKHRWLGMTIGTHNVGPLLQQIFAGRADAPYSADLYHSKLETSISDRMILLTDYHADYSITCRITGDKTQYITANATATSSKAGSDAIKKAIIKACRQLAAQASTLPKLTVTVP